MLLDRLRDQRLRFPGFLRLFRRSRRLVCNSSLLLFHREERLLGFAQLFEFTKRRQLGDVLEAEMLQKKTWWSHT